MILADRTTAVAPRQAIGQHNGVLTMIVATIVAAGAVILTVSPIRRLLGFAPLSPLMLAAALAVGVMLLLLLEAMKSWRVAGRGPLRSTVCS